MFRDQQGNPGFILLKMGEREHMEQFRKGRVFLNTLEYFRKLERDPARADHYEGLTHIFQPNDVIMKLSVPGHGELTIKPSELAAPLTVAAHAEACCNLLCLFSITSPVKGLLFPAEHEWFGDSVVLIRQTQEFCSRLSGAMKARGLSGRARHVDYYDDATFTGELNKFKKPQRFAYQQEYRIAIDTPGTEPLTLELGDISDITSEVIPFKEANNAFLFSEEDAREAGLTWRASSSALAKAKAFSAC